MKNKISKKELVTLSNTTNLEWQFNDLGLIQGNYPKLIEKLKPESFIREDKNGNFIGYPYMPNVKQKDSASDEEKEKGLDGMRKNVPVVMNYLEECDKWMYCS